MARLNLFFAPNIVFKSDEMEHLWEYAPVSNQILQCLAWRDCRCALCRLWFVYLSIISTLMCDHISPVLAELHWLPIRQCITVLQDSSSGVEMSTWQTAVLPCRSVHSGHFSRGKASITLCNDWNPSLAQSSDCHRPAPLWLNSEFGAAYKYPDSTQLNSHLD